MKSGGIKQSLLGQFNYMNIGHDWLDSSELWWFKGGRLHFEDADTDDDYNNIDCVTHASVVDGPTDYDPQGRIDHKQQSISAMACLCSATSGRRLGMAIRRLQARFDGYTVHVFT